ncbi:BA14K family protein [Sphingomonas aracearum]|nr:BA14K family protein [Sphingomonas aracearum]
MTSYLTGLAGIALILAGAAPAAAQPRRDDRGAQAQRRAQPAPRPQAQPAPNTLSRYGNWDSRWGARPAAPPKHWTRQGDWYRHVRACQQRFRGYDARTDTYRVGNGRTQRCTL